MDETRQTEDEHAALWNGRSGCVWVDAREQLDGLFQPFEQLLAGVVAARPESRVLDVGCGTGATTLAALRRLGPRGSCTGVDISAPMLAAARERAEAAGLPARFVLADAQTHPFEPASFDLLISRFGVMFFADPVAAFANLRRAAADDAELRFIAWRDPAENPFMTTASRAAAPLLPDLPVSEPNAPGQFGFADPDRVRAILAGGGWRAIDLQPLDVTLTMPASQLVPYVTRLGPVGIALKDRDEQTRARIVESVRPAFDPYVHGDEVRFTAACWSIGANA